MIYQAKPTMAACSITESASSSTNSLPTTRECSVAGGKPVASEERAGSKFQMQLDDSVILKRIQEGDSRAVGLLYDRYSSLVYSVSLHILRDPAGAEDALQEVLISVCERPNSFRTDNRLSSLMAVASRNRSIDILRRRHPSIPVDDVVLTSPYDIAHHTENNLMCERARTAIGELPPEQRTALEMAYFKGITHSEIALETGCPWARSKPGSFTP